MNAWQNPALTLRVEIAARYPGAMLRWDASGRALLVCDAPRRGWAVSEEEGTLCREGLAYFDLPRASYAALTPPAPRLCPYADGWMDVQAALAGALFSRAATETPPWRGSVSDESRALLRGALLAAARGEAQIRAFIPALRAACAQALRVRDAALEATCRVAALILADWLQTHAGLGVPRGAAIGQFSGDRGEILP